MRGARNYRKGNENAIVCFKISTKVKRAMDLYNVSNGKLSQIDYDDFSLKKEPYSNCQLLTALYER